MPILPAKPFYLIRHGETVVNAEHLIGGGADPEITEKGIMQAKEVGSWVHKVSPRPSCLVRSDRSRTKITAECVNENLGLDIHIEPDLDEHDFGDMIGMKAEEAFEIVLKRGETPPNGESFADFTLRIQKSISHVLDTYPDTPMIVAHGGLFRAIAKMYDLPLWKSGNCELHYFEPIDNEKFPWKVTRYFSDSEAQEVAA